MTTVNSAGSINTTDAAKDRLPLPLRRTTFADPDGNEFDLVVGLA